MKSMFITLLCVFMLTFTAMFCIAEDEPPPPTDPFDALIAAATQVADMSAALKPAADNVDAKAEAVARKQSELSEAQTAHESAKVSFNEALANFIAAVDALKAAAEQIPQANGGT